MDFRDSPEEAAYRTRVRQWLEAHTPRADVERKPNNEVERLAAARAWQAVKAADGYARVSWPVEWGGGGGSPIQQIIFSQEEARFEVPTGFFGISLGMCMPTLQKFADAVTVRRFVPPALRGEQIWCQLFSEPSAGSDLAGLRTRAVRRDEDWVVNGQKVWTTGAHYSDFGLLLARSNVDVPKHAGLTMFWVDMKSPGIAVRPIHQMSGGSDFNEVYLTELIIPDAQRLGPVGGGWQVALVTLMNERLEGAKDRGPSTQDILDFTRAVPRGEGSVLNDSAFRQRLARWYVQEAGLKFTRFRTATALSRGQTPGPEASIGKLVAASRLQDLTGALLDCQEQYGMICDPAWAALEGTLHRDFLYAPGLRIAGGTDEILKNIIAERILGLPAEIRTDKSMAFNALPTGR
jgi:alkylation response protein AidB-like acyl-CoA dehydrogenase